MLLVYYFMCKVKAFKDWNPNRGKVFVMGNVVFRSQLKELIRFIPTERLWSRSL